MRARVAHSIEPDETFESEASLTTRFFVCIFSFRFGTQLIDTTLLTAEEREWLDDYHATVLATLGPLLKDGDPDAYAYLVRETRPLG